jgi:hypothetical protein
MDLPAELREEIYERALGPRLYPLSTVLNRNDPQSLARAAVHWGRGFYNTRDRRQPQEPSFLYGPSQSETADKSDCEPNLALLRTSKLIHHEARSAGWEKTRKCFVAPNHLQSVLNAAITPQFNWLNKIILDFTMDGWFKFFGVDIWPNFHIDSSRSLGYLLSTMPGLDYLQMWFRSPDDGHNTSPWCGSSVIIPPYICCQRVMVDWIMTFAWPFIKSLSKVTIGGAVKKDSKVKWDGLLALSSTDKGTVLDQPTEERAILNTHPSQL